MKKIIFFLFLIIFAQAGFSATFEAVVRTSRHKAKIQKVDLQDLVSKDSFDGKYFKIVKGKDDQAISFKEKKDILLRAATVYHHLTVARNYFVSKVKSDFVAKLPKLIIRIELTNQFSELGHFAHDNYDPQFNNALTVPAGKGLASKGIKPWGLEIWFRPQKKIHLRDLKVNDLASREFAGLMKGFRNQIHMQSLQRFLATTVNAVFVQNRGIQTLTMDNVMRTAGSSIIMELGYQFFDPITKATSRKWYWMDTALIPEVIYHEYAHAALSDHLVLSHSSAIIEGMADFFAGQIAHSPKLAKKIKKYNVYNGKNAKRRQDYMIQFEMDEYANTDFVFGLLWELKNIIGKEKGESFMFELRKNLTTNSTIRGGLVEGILTTCEEVCDQPFVDKLRILMALELRGL